MRAGMGVPRPPVDMVSTDVGIRVFDRRAGVDHTPELMDGVMTHGWTGETDEIDGVILKSKSPSCGWGTVRIYARDETVLTQSADGLLAAEIRRRLVGRAVVDEHLYSEARNRLLFWIGVAIHWRWRNGVLDSTRDEPKFLNGLISRGFGRPNRPDLSMGRISTWARGYNLGELTSIATWALGDHLTNGALFALDR